MLKLYKLRVLLSRLVILLRIKLRSKNKNIEVLIKEIS